MIRITEQEFMDQLSKQSVSSRRHACFVCPICQTPQSFASLVAAGVDQNEAGKYVGFSCEGRFTNAGSWVDDSDRSEKAAKRRTIRGCDWVLGGLFQFHNLEVETKDGKVHPYFEIASPAVAQELEKTIRATEAVR